MLSIREQVVHVMSRKGMLHLALSIDEAMRLIMPTVYLCIVFLLILGGVYRGGNVAMLAGIAAAMGLALTLFSYISIFRKLQKRTKTRRKILRELIGLDASTPGADVKLKTAFNIFDKDRSGRIDRKEMSLLLRCINPKLSKKKVQQMVDETGMVDDIGLDDFLEQMKLCSATADAMADGSGRRFRTIVERTILLRKASSSGGLKVSSTSRDTSSSTVELGVPVGHTTATEV